MEAIMHASTHNNRAILGLIAAGRLMADVNTGDVYSCRPNREPLRLKPKMSKGYCQYRFYWKGRLRHLSGHRIIWLTAHGHIPPNKTIDHINRVTSDNRLVNLRLATNKQQYRNSERDIGSARKGSKLTEVLVKQLRKEYKTGVSSITMAKRLNVHDSVIRRMLQRKTWRHVK